MNIEYAEETIDLLDKIVQINHIIFNGMYDSKPYSIDEYRERLSKGDPVIYIAKFDDMIIGNIISIKKEDSLYLWILGVSEKFRKCGVASRLFELTEQYAKKNNFNSITTKVYNVSKEMLRISLKRGYKIVDMDKHESNTEYNSVHLKLDLSKTLKF